ncbi:MAG: RsmE family RNA methyltransferase [Planctomycetes bacterium]|nr:RsmE family RNA methyltransferase [Planctomycetota bacterium]
MRFICLWAGCLQGKRQGDCIELDSAESHHFKNVLRGKVGYELNLMDGLGYMAKATCKGFNNKIVECMILDVKYYPRLGQLHVMGPIPKGRRFPYLLEKLQECGVSSWSSLSTEHSVREELSESMKKKINERLKDACKQSRNPWLMTIGESSPMGEELIKQPERMVLDVAGSYLRPGEIKCKSEASLIYGPEAGWSPSEIALFEEEQIPRVKIAGYHLRMETAALLGAGRILEELNAES